MMIWRTAAASSRRSRASGRAAAAAARRPTTITWSDDNEPPRKRSTHDSTADLEGVPRDAARAAHAARARRGARAHLERGGASEAARPPTTDARQRAAVDDGLRRATTAETRGPAAGHVETDARAVEAARRRTTTSSGRGAAAGAARPRPTASGVIRESRPRRSGAAQSVQRRTPGSSRRRSPKGPPSLINQQFRASRGRAP